MSDHQLPSDVELMLEELCKKTQISPSSIHHIILSNGVELFGEIVELTEEDLEEELTLLKEEFDDIDLEDFMIDSNEMTIMFPMKIVEEPWLSPSGSFEIKKHLECYSPYASDPLANISKNLIVSKHMVTPENAIEYMKTVYEVYMSMEASTEEPAKILLAKDNVVNFQAFKDKKALKKL